MTPYSQMYTAKHIGASKRTHTHTHPSTSAHTLTHFCAPARADTHTHTSESGLASTSRLSILGLYSKIIHYNHQSCQASDTRTPRLQAHISMGHTLHAHAQGSAALHKAIQLQFYWQLVMSDACSKLFCMSFFENMKIPNRLQAGTLPDCNETDCTQATCTRFCSSASIPPHPCTDPHRTSERTTAGRIGPARTSLRR